MNSSSFVLDPISQNGVLVTIALVLAAILAILTVIGMIWGSRLKRRRAIAERQEEERIESLKADGVTVTNRGDGDTAPPSSPPVAVPAPAAPAVGAAPIADEPIAPLTPAPEAGAAPLTTLKGLGPKIAARLAELGITRIDQLAWIDDAEARDLDAQMGAFQGRIERDRWREQARLLADGDRAGYEAQFGKLG